MGKTFIFFPGPKSEKKDSSNDCIIFPSTSHHPSLLLLLGSRRLAVSSSGIEYTRSINVVASTTEDNRGLFFFPSLFRLLLHPPSPPMDPVANHFLLLPFAISSQFLHTAFVFLFYEYKYDTREAQDGRSDSVKLDDHQELSDSVGRQAPCHHANAKFHININRVCFCCCLADAKKKNGSEKKYVRKWTAATVLDWADTSSSIDKLWKPLALSRVFAFPKSFPNGRGAAWATAHQLGEKRARHLPRIEGITKSLTHWRMRAQKVGRTLSAFSAHCQNFSMHVSKGAGK